MSRLDAVFAQIAEIKHDWEQNEDGEWLGTQDMHLDAIQPIFDAYQGVLDGLITPNDLVVVLERVFDRLYCDTERPEEAWS